MMVWFVIYCFPFGLPTDAGTMNYASLIWGGLTILVTTWWFIGARKGYPGPKNVGGGNTEVEQMRSASTEKRTSL